MFNRDHSVKLGVYVAEKRGLQHLTHHEIRNLGFHVVSATENRKLWKKIPKAVTQRGGRIKV